MKRIKQKFDDGAYQYIIGVDPGVKTWLGAVRRTIETGKEFLVKISSGEFHNRTKQFQRDKKAEQMTANFERKCRRDRENREIYPETPSSNSSSFEYYVEHKLKFFNRGIKLYCKQRYTRLSFDKYIRSTRAVDNILGKANLNDMICLYFSLHL